MGAKGKSKATMQDLSAVEALARDGATDAQIAKYIGVSTSTLYVWKQKFPEFSEAIKRGKEISDYTAETALFVAATGYRYEEITKEPILDHNTKRPLLDDNGEPILVVTKIVDKVAHPNTTALIYWLKNRKPEAWRDRKGGADATVVRSDENDWEI